MIPIAQYLKAVLHTLTQQYTCNCVCNIKLNESELFMFLIANWLGKRENRRDIYLSEVTRISLYTLTQQCTCNCVCNNN